MVVTMESAKSELKGLAVYMCPACKGKLEPAQNALRCSACAITYPLVGKIPDFLLEDRELALGPVMRSMVASVVRAFGITNSNLVILKAPG